MTSKKIYIILISILSVILSAVLFFIGFRYNTSLIAKQSLNDEITLLESSTSELQAMKDSLDSQISDIDTELSTEETMNNYYMEYYKAREELQAEIEELQSQAQELERQIEEKKNQTDTMSTSEGKEGKSYNLKSTQTYSCPDDIPEGRYKATGSGTLIISSLSGGTRINENLGVAFENTYTFNLKENEKIKVSADTVLTELK